MLKRSDIFIRISGWRLRLPQFDFDVVQKAVNKHQVPSALCRPPSDGADITPHEGDLSLLVLLVSAARFCEVLTTKFVGKFSYLATVVADVVPILVEERSK